jgi:SPP1 gp7 family putative phage head morphogenesis protein
MTKKYQTAPKNIKKGKRLNYSVSLQQRYQAQLELMVRRMNNATKKEVLLLFTGKMAKTYFKKQRTIAEDETVATKAKRVLNALTARFQQLFSKSAHQIASTMIEESGQASAVALRLNLKTLTDGLTIKTDFYSSVGRERTQALINENVSLIKSIPAKYFVEISGAVMRSISIGQGGSLGDLQETIEKYGNMSKRRAQLIALDQTRKAYNTINRQRLMDLGFSQFEWAHSGGSQHPRKSHVAMSGKIFRFDDPPVINQENLKYEAPQRGFPGDAPNCRCTMGPVINWEELK